MTGWNPGFYDLSPIFVPFEPLAHTIKQHHNWPTCEDIEYLKQACNSRIYVSSGQLLRFVPQENELFDTVEQGYESRIYQTGQVVTRSTNWHDFFNALVWMIFPQAKAALNQIHYHALSDASSAKIGTRGPLRDAATLFDESGVIVLSSQPALIELLKQRAWKTVFWKERRSVLSSMRFIVFGHALYEKALNPYVGMTGKAICFQVGRSFLQRSIQEQLKAIDQWLTDFLLQQMSCSTDLSPLPILGYPGWSPDNEVESYYDNQQYFRP